MANTDLTAERLREILHYDPDTGFFTWLVGNRARKGSRAGCVGGIGYRVLRLPPHTYLEHRLIFLWMDGKHPDLCIDHINGIRHDNRWANLRHAARKLNNQNIHKAQANNKSGFLGVHWCERRKVFVAQIQAGKQRRIGDYSTAEEAHQAYLEEKRRLHEGCTL